MDGTIMVAVIIIMSIVCVIAFMMMVAGKEKRKRQQLLKQEIANAASRAGANIQHEEIFHNRAMGIDPMNGILVYVKQSDTGFDSRIIDLAQVVKTEIIKKGHKITETLSGGAKRSQEHISEFQLHLWLVDKSAASLTFYSEIEDGMLEMDAVKQKTESWQAMIAIRKVAGYVGV